MGKPHKFQKEIIAWANGEDIEVKYSDKWIPLKLTHPYWDESEYRIKPAREYPKTSLTDEELRAYHHRDPSRNYDLNNRDEGLRCVANAAIARFLDDQENKE